MHGTDRDTDSLSDWGGQGDPAVTVDWRQRDEATLRPSLPPLQKNHLLTLPSAPQGEALGASRPRTSAASRGGQRVSCFISSVHSYWRSTDWFCLSVSLYCD